MIKKSMLGLVFGSVLVFGNTILSINKLNSIECKIIKNNNTDVNCTKKGTYPLAIGDEIVSSLKKNNFEISYHTTDSVFVLNTENGYKIDTSIVSWLMSLYDNTKNPNVNDGNGGTYGINKKKKTLPTKSKLFYNEEIIFKIDFQFNKCELKEKDSGNKINQGFSLKKESSQISINTKKLDKNKIYNLYIYHGTASRHTIKISFLKNRKEQTYKEFLTLEEKKQTKYRQTIYRELRLNLNFYNGEGR